MTESLLLLPGSLVAMSGAVAPSKKNDEVDRFTLNDERPFDSYIAKYEAEKQLKNNPALQAELHGQRVATSGKKKKPKRKKSRVSKLKLRLYVVDHISVLCLEGMLRQITSTHDRL
jgi:hypothetical protein